MSDPAPDLLAYAPDPEAYATGEAPDWLDELDLSPAPPHLRMGTRAEPVAAHECLRVDRHRAYELALRARLLDEQHALVYACAPHAMEACEETRALADAFLAAHALAPTSTSYPPLEAAGRAVQEDLCVLVQRDGGWHLDAAVLCFPSLWSLTEKFGMRIDGVHGPVPHYGTDLAERLDRFLDRLAPGRVVRRRNLSVKPYPLLWLPVAKSDALPGGAPVQPDGAPYWLRTEHQTLQRFPNSGAILFTIKTQLAPLGVLRSRPDVAARLVTQLDSWSEQLHGYKTSGGRLREHVVPWLHAIAERDTSA